MWKGLAIRCKGSTEWQNVVAGPQNWQYIVVGPQNWQYIVKGPQNWHYIVAGPWCEEGEKCCCTLI